MNLHSLESGQLRPAGALSSGPRHLSPSRKEAARGFGRLGRGLPSRSTVAGSRSGDSSNSSPAPTIGTVGIR
eukprot:CAMPEP_0114256600 /NCGR_PEP_ID=MMETSP0058-20121206/18253_1 /TAXON_ID=36894 /ORGANISM="Pyramimonas parkeae, CCMP726" /LENGTH=71 /DNA_ID=CAMNT_0001371205 /DNA_START=343 /DNA_END=558 /DNA_ORIENTATION=-